MLTAFVMCVTFFLSAQGVTITYDLNGGELSNGANSYQADSNNNNNAVLDNPTKTGYIFTGWCDTNDYTAATNTCSNRVGLVTTNNNNATKTMVRWTVPNDLSTDTTFIAMWEEDKFQMGITGIVANYSFPVSISAGGEFWIDWGDGNVEYINNAVYRTSQNDSSHHFPGHSHTYAEGGNYTLHFGGLATGYSYFYQTYFDEADLNGWQGFPVIDFGSQTESIEHISNIYGSLGAIFPTLSDTTNLSGEDLYAVQPSFQELFYRGYEYWGNEGGLTGTLPNTLFSGIYGQPVKYMFFTLVAGQSGLTGSIPSGFFGDLSGAPVARIFDGTFDGCSGLTGSIPSGLFGNLVGVPGSYTFFGTFDGCSGLTGEIPATLFSGISGGGNRSFEGTFAGCSNLGKNNGTRTYYISPTLMDRSDISIAFIGENSSAGFVQSCPNDKAEYYKFDNWSGGGVSCITPNSLMCPAGQSLDLDNNGNYVCTNCSGANCPTTRTVQTCPSGYTNNADFSACIQPYTITYENVTGATVSGPVQYYYESDTGRYYHRFSTNKTWNSGYSTSVCVGTGGATKPNYQITGWCEGQNNCPNPQSSICIENGDTGNKTLYAQWEVVCPATSMPSNSGINALPYAWFDLDNNGQRNLNECISMMYTMDDDTAAQTCMYKALCNAAPAMAANMNVPCAQLESATCDYATAGLSYATCRYNAQTYESAGFYTDCSTVVNVCNDADMLALLPAMGGQTDSAGLFPVELTKKGYNQTGSNVSNWNTYFGQSVLTLIPLVQNGMSFGDAWDTLNTYNTCSGGSAFTCESNTWLHVGNEQICTYATKTTDRALAIRVDANHVYYVMLTPASENDYPIHAGSNHKLKIREYNAAGTESTIYNAHDMSVVSE